MRFNIRSLFTGRSIRERLFTAFVLIALLAVIGNTIGSFVVGYFDEQDQARQQMEAVALSKSLQLETWTSAMQNELIVILNEEYAADRIENILTMAVDDKTLVYLNGAVRERLRLFTNSTEAFDEFSILDLEGNILLSTDETREGINAGDQLFYSEGVQKPFAQFPFLGENKVHISRPIVTLDGTTLGVLAGSTNLNSLVTILEDQTGMGSQTVVYLLDEFGNKLSIDEESANSILLTAAVNSSFVDDIPGSQELFTGMYRNEDNFSVMGTARWLDAGNMSIVVEQRFSAVLQTVFAALGVNLAITAVVILLAVLVSSLIARGISNPLIQLSETASQIAAGDLNQQVESDGRKDEIGVLAHSFNSMTKQLQDAFHTLEQRVEERTLSLQEANRALANQALQLKTNARVSREITSILDIDQLLKRVARLITEAFNLEDVDIYLLDDARKKLYLRASSRKDLLKGEKSEASYQVVNQQQPVINAEKGQLIVPLRFSGQVLGTLNIHQKEHPDFIEGDLLVFQSLADQIAVAIQNAHLYNRSRELAIVEERTRLAKDLHDSVTQSLYSLNLMVEGWRLSSSPEKVDQVDGYLERVGEIVQQMLSEMRLMIYELKPPVLVEEGLLVALRKRLETVEKRTGLKTRFRMEEFDRLPAEIEENLYYIAQEALNNILKHAEASEVTIYLFKRDNVLQLKIEDNGKGFDQTVIGENEGFGLGNMRDRAELIGGEVILKSSPKSGTIVQVNFPLPNGIREGDQA